MKRIVAVFAAVMFASMALPAASMAADVFPSKPITAMVPMAAGGSSDLLARAIEKFWPKYSKQPMVGRQQARRRRGGRHGRGGPLQAGRLHPLSRVRFGARRGHAVPPEDAVRPVERPCPRVEGLHPLRGHRHRREIRVQLDQGHRRLVQKGREAGHDGGVREGRRGRPGAHRLRQGGGHQHRHGPLLRRRRGHHGPGGRTPDDRRRPPLRDHSPHQGRTLQGARGGAPPARPDRFPTFRP